MKFFFLLLFIISCSSVQKFQDKRADFLGYWVGEVPTLDGKRLKWLIERRIDGSFTLTHFIKSSPQDPVKFDPETATFELGVWGVSGDIYFTATRQYFENKKVKNLDVTDANLYDAYQIVSFDGSTLVYRALETDEEFTTQKVPKGTPIEL